MGLFIKRTDYGTHTPLYRMGAEMSVLIIGLGNVGEKYLKTRHNAGFMVVDYIANKHDFPAWQEKKDLKCFITSQTIIDTRVILIKPTTFMNLSGEAAQAVQHFYKLSNSKTIAVYDELDINFGTIRTRNGGSAGGHNGVKSLIQHLGEDFGRIRIGIGPKDPPQIDSADFVLAPFSKQELKNMQVILAETDSIISEIQATGQITDDTQTVLF